MSGPERRLAPAIWIHTVVVRNRNSIQDEIKDDFTWFLAFTFRQPLRDGSSAREMICTRQI